MEPRRILLITYNFAPSQNPRAFRWTALAQHWTKRGDKVDVITSWVPGLARKEVSNDVNIFRVGGKVSERLRRLFDSSGNSSTNTGISEHDRIQKKTGFRELLGKLVKGIHDLTWRNIYWPDYACLWYRLALSLACKLLDEKKHEKKR